MPNAVIDDKPFAQELHTSSIIQQLHHLFHQPDSVALCYLQQVASIAFQPVVITTSTRRSVQTVHLCSNAGYSRFGNSVF